MTDMLDVDAARRQSFGQRYAPHPSDDPRAIEIMAGRVTLGTHVMCLLPPPQEITWSEDPLSSLNWRNHLQMLDWLDPLRRRAAAGNREALSTWTGYALSWCATHLPAKHHGDLGWTPAVAGARITELALGTATVAECGDRDSLVDLVGAIHAHLVWADNQDLSNNSTHTLALLSGLFTGAAILGELEIRERTVHRIVSHFSATHDVDGLEAARSIPHQVQRYRAWSEVRQRLEYEGFMQAVAELAVLDNVPDFVAHSTMPTGKLLPLGDSAATPPPRLDSPSVDWVRTAGSAGEPPPGEVHLYGAGFLFGRSGWGAEERDFAEETQYSLAFAPNGRAKEHDDELSLTFTSMGREWVADPGKVASRSGDVSEASLRRAHSSLWLAGVDRQATAHSRVSRHNVSAQAHDTVIVDEGYPGSTLTRRTIYSTTGEYIVVIDTVDSEKPVTAVQSWRVPSEITPTTTPQGFRLDTNDRHAYIVFSGTRPKMSAETPSQTGDFLHRLRFTKHGRAFRFITVLAAGYRDSVPEVTTIRTRCSGRVVLVVDTGRVMEQLVIDPEEVFVRGADERVADRRSAELRRPSARLNPLDHDLRSRILERLSRALYDGFAAPMQDARSAIAAQLREAVNDIDLSEFDLGITGVIHDLECVSFSDVPHHEVRRDRPGLIAWPDRPDYRPTVSRHPTVSMRGTDIENPMPQTDAMLTFGLDSIVLAGMWAPQPGTTLTVMFHGAIDRTRMRLPLFQRLRFQKSLEAGPTIAFSDPTLDLSRQLRLGWYLGTERLDLAAAIAKIVTNIASDIGATNTVVQGSSGGGFAALQVGTLIPGAHVVAFNPQTDLSAYNANSYTLAMNTAFGLTEAKVPDSLAQRINVMDRIAFTGSAPDITLVMNSGDMSHEAKHAVPLRTFMKRFPGARLHDVTFDLGPGHRSPDNQQYRAVMREVYRMINPPVR